MRNMSLVLLLGATMLPTVHSAGTAEAAAPFVSKVVVDEPVASLGINHNFGEKVLVLSNGNYAVTHRSWWNGSAEVGAVHLFDGSENSLISTLTGSTALDDIGSTQLFEVGSSDFVAVSRNWDNGAAVNAGAVTWIDGTTGLDGVVSASNSLVGTSTGDSSDQKIHILDNGDVVVASPEWDGPGAVDAGAVTWVSGATGLAGERDASNSLIGLTAGDRVGDRVTVLDDGNVVVASPWWSAGGTAEVGAVTWVDADAGITGPVSTSNSLHGSTASDRVGSVVVELTDGRYVVSSPRWDHGAVENAGAATWIGASTPRTGPVTVSNSVHGTHDGDFVGGVTPLRDGNYLVVSSSWGGGGLEGRGAVTWADGSTGRVGPVTAANSLHGTNSMDRVGRGDVRALVGGDYVIISQSWQLGGEAVGAVTTVRTAAARTGPVTASNSLHGNLADDLRSATVIPLADGAAVIRNRGHQIAPGVEGGAATWIPANGAPSGPISLSNSVIGEREGDLSTINVRNLPDGSFAIGFPKWDRTSTGVVDAGAVVFGDATTGVSGPINESTALVGSSTGDGVGSIVSLPNGDVVVSTPNWDDGATADVGAVTHVDPSNPIVGPVSTANSLHGTTAGDNVGETGITVLSSGAYVVASPSWDNGATADVGAATWMSGQSPVTGPVSPTNSLHGVRTGDRVSSGLSVLNRTVVELSNGDYAVSSPEVDGPTATDIGAVTWGDGTTGIVGPVGPGNSLVGVVTGDQVGSGSAFSRHMIDETPEGDAVVYHDQLERFGVRGGAITFAPAAQRPTGPLTPFNTVFATSDRERLLRPANPFNGEIGELQLTTDDAVVIPSVHASFSAGRDDIVLMRLDLDPFFTEVPPDIDVATAPGATTATVTFDAPAADDFRDTVAPPVTCTPASGSDFPVGETVVECTASDSAGSAATTSFTVTVNATAGPDLDPDPDLLNDFEPLTPARLLDTRPDSSTIDGLDAGGGRIEADSQIAMTAAGRAGLPDDATAAVLNVTAIRPDSVGFLTIHPCGTRPVTSSLNFGPGDIVGNEIVAKLSPDGSTCIYSSAGADLTVDVVGYVPTGAGYRSLEPDRITDTREAEPLAGGTEIEVQVAGEGGVPTDSVAAAVLNVTAIRPVAPGFLTIHPCGERPLASSLNFGAGDIVGNEIVAPLSSSGSVCIFGSASTNVTVDVSGYVPEQSTYVPTDPARLLDTRATGETIDGVGAGAGPVAAMTEIELVIAGRAGVTDGVMAVLNVTAIKPDAVGFLTIHPCGERPLASSLNFGPGDVVGNEVIAPLSPSGSICIYASAGTHLTADLVGHVPVPT